MEPLWSPVVATDGNQWRIRSARKPQKQAKSVAVGCHQLPLAAHGKGRVDATSLLQRGGHFPGSARESSPAQRRARGLDGDSNRPEVEKRWLSSSALAGADQGTTTTSTSHAICYSRACVPLYLCVGVGLARGLPSGASGDSTLAQPISLTLRGWPSRPLPNSFPDTSPGAIRVQVGRPCSGLPGEVGDIRSPGELLAHQAGQEQQRAGR